MDYIIEITLVSITIIGALTYIIIQNREDKKEIIVTTKPVVVAKELEGYEIVEKEFPYGPPSSKTITIKGKLVGDPEGEYLFVPLRVEPFQQGFEIWGDPSITIGTLYKKVSEGV